VFSKKVAFLMTAQFLAAAEPKNAEIDIYSDQEEMATQYALQYGKLVKSIKMIVQKKSDRLRIEDIHTPGKEPNELDPAVSFFNDLFGADDSDFVRRYNDDRAAIFGILDNEAINLKPGVCFSKDKKFALENAKCISAAQRLVSSKHLCSIDSKIKWATADSNFNITYLDVPRNLSLGSMPFNTASFIIAIQALKAGMQSDVHPDTRAIKINLMLKENDAFAKLMNSSVINANKQSNEETVGLEKICFDAKLTSDIRAKFDSIKWKMSQRDYRFISEIVGYKKSCNTFAQINCSRIKFVNGVPLRFYLTANCEVNAISEIEMSDQIADYLKNREIASAATLKEALSTIELCRRLFAYNYSWIFNYPESSNCSQK